MALRCYRARAMLGLLQSAMFDKPSAAGTAMVTLADARNASAKPGSVGGDLLVLLSGVAYAVRDICTHFSSRDRWQLLCCQRQELWRSIDCSICQRDSLLGHTASL